MDFLDLLHDPAYRHILLNHIPVIGLAVSWLVLSLGLVTRQVALLLTGLALVAVTAGTALPVAFYGDAAYPAIYDGLDGHGRAWLDRHAERADTWLPTLMVTAALAIVALVAGIARRSLLLPAAALVALVSLAGLAGALLIAAEGGRVKHPEFRIDDEI